jgi:hypothetical protein
VLRRRVDNKIHHRLAYLFFSGVWLVVDKVVYVYLFFIFSQVSSRRKFVCGVPSGMVA